MTDHLTIESINKKIMKALNAILRFDPYMNLCSVTLQAIFDIGRQKDDVKEDLLLNFSYDYSEDAKVFHEILFDGYINKIILCITT